jgi:hypothetical protein
MIITITTKGTHRGTVMTDAQLIKPRGSLRAKALKVYNKDKKALEITSKLSTKHIQRTN